MPCNVSAMTSRLSWNSPKLNAARSVSVPLVDGHWDKETSSANDLELRRKCYVSNCEDSATYGERRNS